MKHVSAPPEISLHTARITGFVQTERKTHEAWARFAVKKPTASALLHYLVAFVGPQNAVVVPQKTLAKVLGVTDRTIRTAISDLEAGNWLQVVKLGRGKECAYVLNDKVAWAEKRDKLRLSKFTAEVIADAEDQSPETLADTPLNRFPRVFAGEQQLPSGPGLPPPSEPFLDGMEPDLPATRQPESELVQSAREALDIAEGKTKPPRID